MTENETVYPETPESALELYLNLRNHIHSELNNWLA